MELKLADRRPKYLFLITILHLAVPVALEETHFDVALPGFHPETDEAYVCVTVAVPVSGYITAFSPLSSSIERVHHAALHACTDILHPVNVPWLCKYSATCVGYKILYTWGHHTGPFVLPNDTGIPIGQDAGFSYALLRVHYGRKFERNIFDYSGIRVHVRSERTARIAGMHYSYANVANRIPANTADVVLNQSCQYTFRSKVYAFAYRVHTHRLGRRVSGYKYSSGDNTWTTLGDRNPQLPQRYITLEYPVELSYGDILASQCRFDSTERSRTTSIGQHTYDEMCVFYTLHFVNAEEENVANEFISCGSNQYDVFDNYPLPSPSGANEDESIIMSGEGEATFTISESAILLPSNIGRIMSLALGRNGNLVLLHIDQRFSESNRSEVNNVLIAENVIAQISSEGALLDQWGKGTFDSPSGMFIDEDDSIWIVDTKQQQVFKFNRTTSSMKLLLKLGRRFEAGDDQEHFCDPSAVAVSSRIVFVADGCEGRSRISKFSSVDGKPLGSWTFTARPQIGSSGDKAKTSISTDSKNRRIFVANSHNAEVRIFSYDGSFLGRMESTEMDGSILGVSYCSEKDTLFLINRDSGEAKSRIFAVDATTNAPMYSWTPDDETLMQADAILASSDCARVYIAGQSTKILQFNIYTNMTHRSNIDYTMMEIEEAQWLDGQESALWTLILVLIPVVCAIAILTAALRRRPLASLTWRCTSARLGPSSRGAKLASGKYAIFGYRDYYKGYRQLTPESEHDSSVVFMDYRSERDQEIL